jgi:transposase-like protein
MTRRKALTPAIIRAIRASYRPGKRGSGYLSLARKYGVGASTVRDCVKYYTAYGLNFNE